MTNERNYSDVTSFVHFRASFSILDRHVTYVISLAREIQARKKREESEREEVTSRLKFVL